VKGVSLVAERCPRGTGTTAQARAALTEANRLSFFMVSRRLDANNRLGMRPVPLILDQLNGWDRAPINEYTP
jgi:hypothetical protein